MKKFFAELLGTFVLTFMGCGTAIGLSCGVDAASVVGTAVAFGLSVVAMAYAFGSTSGCHINPAVTLGVWGMGRMSLKDALSYWCAQLIGGILAGALLMFIYGAETGLGANGVGAGCKGSVAVAFIVEVVLTYAFVGVVLAATDEKKGAGNLAGLAIGLTLVLVHLVGIYFTGTSVNPARSIGPAIFAGGQALTYLWIFIAAPLCGAVLAILCWKYFEDKE